VAQNENTGFRVALRLPGMARETFFNFLRIHPAIETFEQQRKKGPPPWVALF